jgi:hypothetical protein
MYPSLSSQFQFSLSGVTLVYCISMTKTDLKPEVITIYYKVCVVGAREIFELR